MLRTAIVELACCAILVTTAAAIVSAPVIVVALVAGINRLTYQWP